MRVISTILITILVLIAGAVAFVLSGTYNIAATDHHWEITEWLVEKTKDRSIEEQSKHVSAPPADMSGLMEKGAPHFHEMCRRCHGAPGIHRDEFAEGLYPSPPNLRSQDVQAWMDEELFWIVKNGLKLTGMPAFGPTHNDETLWGIVALVRKLPQMSGEDYLRIVQKAAPEAQHMEQPAEQPSAVK